MDNLEEGPTSWQQPWIKVRNLWRSSKYACQHWKSLCNCLVVIAFLCWILWTYQRPVIHTAKFLWNANYRQCAFQRRQYETEERPEPSYVTVAFHGRIGNWMFSYAALLGIAKANGYIPYFSSSHPLTNILDVTRLQDRDADCLYTLYDDFHCSYNPQLMNLPPGNISIEGYIQSWKYFRFIEQEIRKEFRLKDYLRTNAERDYISYFGQYIQEGRVVISIHVRRGDVLRPAARKLGFCHAPKSYIDSAIKYMLERHPHAVLFVASDDIEWCKDNVIPPKLGDVFGSEESLEKATIGLEKKTLLDKVPIVFSRAHDSWSDFSVLTLCNHSIITVGTFGWWSAWLANGHVVYYKDSPLPDTKLAYEMKKEDFFPEHWVALSEGTATSPDIFIDTFYAILFVCFCCL